MEYNSFWLSWISLDMLWIWGIAGVFHWPVGAVFTQIVQTLQDKLKQFKWKLY